MTVYNLFLGFDKKIEHNQYERNALLKKTQSRLTRRDWISGSIYEVLNVCVADAG